MRFLSARQCAALNPRRPQMWTASWPSVTSRHAQSGQVPQRGRLAWNHRTRKACGSRAPRGEPAGRHSQHDADPRRRARRSLFQSQRPRRLAHRGRACGQRAGHRAEAVAVDYGMNLSPARRSFHEKGFPSRPPWWPGRPELTDSLPSALIEGSTPLPVHVAIRPWVLRSDARSLTTPAAAAVTGSGG